MAARSFFVDTCTHWVSLNQIGNLDVSQSKFLSCALDQTNALETIRKCFPICNKLHLYDGSTLTHETLTGQLIAELFPSSQEYGCTPLMIIPFSSTYPYIVLKALMIPLSTPTKLIVQQDNVKIGRASCRERV